mmetsp:Transcript_18493/g.31646  ORF Transcript_18493/g.31646 Transcript_18493/m.31646 type:complete len:151 (-) Transcript_18493:83-535(-)
MPEPKLRHDNQPDDDEEDPFQSNKTKDAIIVVNPSSITQLTSEEEMVMHYLNNPGKEEESKEEVMRNLQISYVDPKQRKKNLMIQSKIGSTSQTSSSRQRPQPTFRSSNMSKKSMPKLNRGSAMGNLSENLLDASNLEENHHGGNVIGQG